MPARSVKFRSPSVALMDVMSWPEQPETAPLVTDGHADPVRIRVGWRADGGRSTGCLQPLAVKLRHACDDAVVAAISHLRRAVGPLHVQRLGRAALAEQPGDLRSRSVCCLPRGQDLGHLLGTQGPA